MNPEHMQRAIALSQEHMNAGDGGPFGAVIVKDNEIIAEGWNGVTSTNDPTAHAEVMAIRSACQTLGTFTLTGCTIYASCEPCPMCLAAIYWARLDTLYFAATRADAAAAGFDDDLLYQELPRAWADRTLPTEQHMPQAAQSVLQAWISKPDKTPY